MRKRTFNEKKIISMIILSALFILMNSFMAFSVIGSFSIPEKSNSTNETEERYPFYTDDIMDDINNGSMKDPLYTSPSITRINKTCLNRNGTVNLSYSNLKETTCSDSIDNDCDLKADCDDTDCKDNKFCNIKCDLKGNKNCCERFSGTFFDSRCCVTEYSDNWCGIANRCLDGKKYLGCGINNYCYLGKCYVKEDEKDINNLIVELEKDPYVNDEKKKIIVELNNRDIIKKDSPIYIDNRKKETIDLEVQILEGRGPDRINNNEIRNIDKEIIERKLQARIDPFDKKVISYDKINIKIFVKNIFIDDFNFNVIWADGYSEEMVLKSRYNGEIELWSSAYLKPGELYKYKIVGVLDDGFVFYDSGYRSFITKEDLMIVFDDEWNRFKTNEKTNITGEKISANNIDDYIKNNNFSNRGEIPNPNGNSVILAGPNQRIHSEVDRRMIIEERILISKKERNFDSAFIDDIQNRVGQRNVFDRRDIVNRISNRNDLNIKYVNTINNMDIDKKAIKESANEENITVIYIKLKPKKTLYNVSIYENIPKGVSASAYNLKYTDSPVVLDEDPLVMWYFAKVDEEIELSYEVNGPIDDNFDESKTIAIADSVGNPWYFILIPIMIIPFIVVFFLYFSKFEGHKDNIALKKEIGKHNLSGKDMDINSMRDFIINGHNMGINKDDIEKNLIKIGWDEGIVKKEINHVFNYKD